MSRNRLEATIDSEEAGLSLLETLAGADRILGLSRALKKGGGVVVKRAIQLCPKPGYPGDDPIMKPLNQTIKAVVRTYENVIVLYAGPQYPAGAHGHLVEFGHWLVLHGQQVLFVKAKPFLRPAADETKGEQAAAIKASLQSQTKYVTPE